MYFKSMRSTRRTYNSAARNFRSCCPACINWRKSSMKSKQYIAASSCCCLSYCQPVRTSWHTTDPSTTSSGSNMPRSCKSSKSCPTSTYTRIAFAYHMSNSWSSSRSLRLRYSTIQLSGWGPSPPIMDASVTCPWSTSLATYYICQLRWPKLN